MGVRGRGRASATARDPCRGGAVPPGAGSAAGTDERRDRTHGPPVGTPNLFGCASRWWTPASASPPDHSRLLDPFSQADASTTRRYGGTGLGLAISSQLVAAMGRRLSIESEVGRGSTFGFELQLRRSAGKPPASSPDAGLLQGLPVLMVHDSATNRLLLETQLRTWSMAPDVGCDAPADLQRLRAAAHGGAPYRLALIDTCMPDVDGLQLARSVSADASLAATEVLMLTSTMGIDPDEARRAGIARMLTEPVRQSQVYDAIMAVLLPAPDLPPPPVQVGPAANRALGHLLVVEDNRTNQLVAAGIPAGLAWSVDIAGNGQEAVDAHDFMEAVRAAC